MRLSPKKINRPSTKMLPAKAKSELLRATACACSTEGPPVFNCCGSTVVKFEIENARRVGEIFFFATSVVPAAMASPIPFEFSPPKSISFSTKQEPLRSSLHSFLFSLNFCRCCRQRREGVGGERGGEGEGEAGAASWLRETEEGARGKKTTPSVVTGCRPMRVETKDGVARCCFAAQLKCRNSKLKESNFLTQSDSKGRNFFGGLLWRPTGRSEVTSSRRRSSAPFKSFSPILKLRLAAKIRRLVFRRSTRALSCRRKK